LGWSGGVFDGRLGAGKCFGTAFDTELGGAGVGEKTLCAQSFSISNTKKPSEIPFFARRGRRANAARRDG
jgi:hypothetical protein